MPTLKVGAILLSVVMVIGLSAAPLAIAQEQPRRGGVLRVALAADPPSLDAHQEQTFAVTQPMSAVYNNLIVLDPHNYPKVVGDVAKSWTVLGQSPDLRPSRYTRDQVPRRQRADRGGRQGQLGQGGLLRRGA